MKTLTIKLKQHTPLIHFQHDQEGATLRASEVKPRLDKYIIHKAFDDNFDKCKQYLVGYNAKNEEALRSKWDSGYRALDYKMKIKAEGTPQEFLIASLLSPTNILDKNEEVLTTEKLPFTILGKSPFFAQENVNSSNKPEDSPVFLKCRKNQNEYYYKYNEDNWESIGKKGLMWGSLEMTITSKHDDVINLVNSHLCNFLICTNFGTRSSKGFGSFTRESDMNKVINALKENYKFVYSKEITDSNIQKIFQTIKGDYQKLKSGTKHPKYEKSILFLYAVSKMKGKPRWEKRFFKQAVLDNMPKNKRLHVERDKNDKPLHKSICGYNDYNDNDVIEYDYRFLRAVLGLAEQYEFLLDYYDEGTNKWKRDNWQKLIVRPKINDVERFESPILFKIINNVIYIVGNEVNKELFGKQSQVLYTIGGEKIEVSDKHNTLSTPTPETFELSDFIEFAMNPRFNLRYAKVK